MSDIVEIDFDGVICPHCTHQFRAIPVTVQDEQREAADEIERLRAENFRLAAITCDTPTMDEWGNKGCAEIERLRAMVDALLDHCPDGECEECSRIFCPHGDVLHLHHDGCPSCYLAGRRAALEDK